MLASSGDPQTEEIEGLRTNKIEKFLDDIFEISKIEIFEYFFRFSLIRSNITTVSFIE